MSPKRKKKRKSNTPKGKDEREVPLPEDYKDLKDQGIKAIKYGNSVYLEGGLYNTEITQEILEKINAEESVVICFTAGPGRGKTYFAMNYAQGLDPKFDVMDTPPPPQNEDHGQVVFGREHLSYLTGPNTPLKRGQVIVLDESHFGVGARSWQDKDQQALVNYIAAIRVKGFVLFLVVLHTRMIDALLRDFVVNYEFNITKRGEARCYRRFFPQFGRDVYKKFLGTMELPLPDEEHCNWLSCLKCKSLRADEDTRCETIRAIYERRKEHFLTEQGQKQEEEVAKTKYMELDAIIQAIAVQKDEIPKKANGTIHMGRCLTWLRKSGYTFRIREEARLIEMIQETYL